MRRWLAAATTLGAVMALSATPALAAPPAQTAPEYAPVCHHPTAVGFASCNAIQLLNPSINWHGSHVGIGGKGGGGHHGPGGGGGTTTPSGYFPADLQSAYGLLTSKGNLSVNDGSGQTVAVVDAYNDPNAASDLTAFRSYFGLPACTASTGCFKQVNQVGNSTLLPSNNTSWSEEISLDLDMISAICPNCKILLVEASSPSILNLGTAENYAAANANAVSNSYGGSEFSTEVQYDTYYDHPGVAITASAGDGGYGVEYPAASPYVTAVGGTTLTSTSSGYSETVWSGTGSGCSAYEPAPSWQPSTPLCRTRTVADVAAEANPNTGVAVYDTYGEPGWMVFGGTSVASPIIASIYALAGNTSLFATSSGASTAAQALYGDSSLNRITSGSNSRRCTTYLCNAADSYTNGSVYYNGPTGNGTPSGLSGF